MAVTRKTNYLTRASEKILREAIALKNKETVAILASLGHERDAVVLSMKNAVSYLGGSPEVIICNNAGRKTDRLSRRLCGYDVILECTRSPIPASTFEQARELGTRGLFMFRLTPQAIVRGSLARQPTVRLLMEKVSSILNKAREIDILAENSDYRFKVQGAKREAVSATGTASKSGEFAFFPPGVIAIAPKEFTADGSILANGTLVGYGKLRNHVSLTFANGLLEKIPAALDTMCGNQLRKRNARVLCEVGCGVSAWAGTSGTGEDERIRGSVHIGLGDNLSFQGEVKSAVHMDFTLKNASLVVDKKTLIERGKLLVH